MNENKKFDIEEEADSTSETSSGYIYVLSNPLMPNLVKIGYTKGQPDKRVQEISGDTGVPVSFNLEFSIFVTDCVAGEKLIHSSLKEKRVNSRREFFEVSVEMAVSTIKSILPNNGSDLRIALGKKYYQKALDFLLPDDGLPPDYARAYQFGKKAADEDYPLAFSLLGLLHVESILGKFDINEAVSLFLQGARLNDLNSLGCLAISYMYLGQLTNSRKTLERLEGILTADEVAIEEFILGVLLFSERYMISMKKRAVQISDSSFIQFLTEVVSPTFHFIESQKKQFQKITFSSAGCKPYKPTKLDIETQLKERLRYFRQVLEKMRRFSEKCGDYRKTQNELNRKLLLMKKFKK